MTPDARVRIVHSRDVAVGTADGQTYQGGLPTVGLYVIERNFAEQLDPAALDRAGIKEVNDEVGIRWMYSFLSADRKKTYCLYEAPDAESLREAAARLGIPADVIIAVDHLDPILAS
jgi:hypothetical protein